MRWKRLAVTGLKEQPESKKTTVDTTTCRSDGPVETSSFTTEVQCLLLTYPLAYTLSRGVLLSMSLTVSPASLKTSSGTAAVIGVFTIIRDLDFHSFVFCNHSSNIGSISTNEEEVFCQR